MLLTKAFSCVVVVSVFALLVQALLSLALLPSAQLHGTTAGADGDWLRSVLGVLLRGTGLVAIAAAVGFSVASIGRNTAAALGIRDVYGRSVPVAALYLTAVGIGLLAVATAVFRRRDVA